MATSFLQLLLLLVSFSFTSLCAPLIAERQTTDAERLANDPIVLPSQDPFYQPPADFKSACAGTVLNKRKIPIPQAIELLAPGKTKEVWQILYRSNDDADKPIAVVTTLFVPKKADPNKFFTQAVAYDASLVDCSASYILRSLPETPPESLIIALALDSGWYVNSPDFESYKAAFTNGVISGRTLLDSLRAGKNSGEFTKLSSNPRITMNGASGGALALEWALELQSTYAPELRIDGTALGSLTPNVANSINAVNGKLPAGLIPAAITGLAQASSELDRYLKDNLLANKSADFLAAKTRCINPNLFTYFNQDIKAYFKSPDFLKDKVPRELIEKVGVMGTHGTPRSPVYIYQGVKDEIGPIADVDALYNKFCSAKAPSISYNRYENIDHSTTSILGFVGAYTWLQDRFNGVAAVKGCNKVALTKTDLDSNDYKLLGGEDKVYVQALKAIKSSPLPTAIVTFLEGLTKSARLLFA